MALASEAVASASFPKGILKSKEEGKFSGALVGWGRIYVGAEDGSEKEL